jgi:hypothetical protein
MGRLPAGWSKNLVSSPAPTTASAFCPALRPFYGRISLYIVLIFPAAPAFNVGLLKSGFGSTLSNMFKSDPSIILLSINAGLPLAALITVVVLIALNMVLA